MNQGEVMKFIFDSGWRFFQINSPFFGLTFAQLFLGVFVVTLSILVLSKIFGSGSLSDDISGNIKKAKNYKPKGKGINTRGGGST